MWLKVDRAAANVWQCLKDKLMNSVNSKFRAKENELTEKYIGTKDEIPIHQVQYMLEDPEREEAFIRNQHPTKDEYERYKWYRNEWHRRPKETDPGDFPLAVCCELVSSCNLSCSMCYTISDDFENAITGAQRMMPWPFVKNIIDEAAELGVPSMLFSWRGEPTLYRWKIEGGTVITFPDVIAYARQAGILEITAITHGQLMDKETVIYFIIVKNQLSNPRKHVCKALVIALEVGAVIQGK